jgi:hypothetical protein
VRFCFIIAFYFLPILTWGQNLAVIPADRFDRFLHEYLKTDSGESPAADNLFALVDKFDKKQESNRDFDFLKVLFSKTHRKFLTEFDQYASFAELFKSGHYNCLTGTALYALLLDRYNFEYRIIETNYHIFLLVKTTKGDVLFETTDPRGGFVSNRKEIDDRIQQYRQNKLQQDLTQKKYCYQFSFDLYHTIGLSELTGLLYFNLSVDAFNHHQFDESIRLLDLAASYYDSERIKEFSRIILLAVTQSDLEAKAKLAYVRKVRPLTKL